MIPDKFFKESGQALVVIALAAVVLFGFTALAIDGGAKFSDRRHAQNAADTAAMAGALALVNKETTACGALQEWECKALLRAEDNGYDDFTNNEVWVFRCNDPARLDPNVPPVDPPLNCGAYEGNENYIEVIILSHVNTTFARVFGWDQFHNLVQAVTYAKPGGQVANGASIASYNPDTSSGCSGSLRIGGSATITLTGGGLFVNSDESDCAMEQQGGCPSNGDPLLVINGGGVSSAGNNNVDFDACMDPLLPSLNITYNQPQIIIPDDVDMPDEPIECGQMTANATYLGLDANGIQMYRIYPGYYEAFPQASLLPTNKHVVMAPGIYCVNENLNWNSNTFKYLDGTAGVTIYITAGHNFNVSDNSPVLLAASDEPGYEGYLIILDGNHNSIQNNCNINGGSYLELTGTIFAPYCQIGINGHSTQIADFNAQVIGWNVQINGSSTINFNYNPDDSAKTRRRVGLMK